MRTPYLAGNWKLNFTIQEAKEFAAALLPLVADANAVEVGLGASFTLLPALATACANAAVNVGAQDCYWEASGAFTGEIAPAQILDTGASFVIVGHSERRQFFGETNETVNRKAKAALAAGLTIIVCVGESLIERENGTTEAVVQDHIENSLAGLSAAGMERVTIAYEPVWAIGTGKTATPEQAQAVHAFIRGLLAKQFDQAVADATRIQYGGSVKPENVRELMVCADIDGALVGGASLKPDSFAQIVNFQQA